MTDRNGPPASTPPDTPQNGDTKRKLPRRRLLAAVAAAGSTSLTGCLSVGPTVRADGLTNSLVFAGVEAAETFSFGGDRLTISVYLKPPAHNRFGVKELEVLAAGARPYSAADADTPPGPFQTGYSVPVDVPVDTPAIISAVNEAKTTVESIRVTNDASAFFTWLGPRAKARQVRIDQHQFPMPAKILTTGFEQRDTQFSTDAWMNGKVKNTARDSELSYLAVEAVFTNDTEEVVDRSVEAIEGLSAGEVWDVVVPVYGDASTVTGGKLTITESHPGRPPIPPTNVTVLEDSLEEPDDELEPPKVVGEVRNTGTAELPFCEASAKFYAENGDVLGDDTATVTGLNPGKTWSFEIPFYAHSNERARRVSEYDLSLVA